MTTHGSRNVPLLLEQCALKNTPFARKLLTWDCKFLLKNIYIYIYTYCVLFIYMYIYYMYLLFGCVEFFHNHT